MFRNPSHTTSRLKRYQFNNKDHYIVTDQMLNKEELLQLSQLLNSFPHSSHAERLSNWPNKFKNLNIETVPEKLILLAANAYDTCGNTVLGVAAEYGSVEAVQRLIEMGADLDTADDNRKKLALHWAINNALSWNHQDSDEAVQVVKCLLDHGARTDITCLPNLNPLEYAKKEGFVAAARIIEKHKKTVPSLYQLSLFTLKNMIKDGVITKNDVANALPKNTCIPASLSKLIK